MTKPRVEIVLERVLFASRWLLAPFYLGLALALLVLLGVFVIELWRETVHLFHTPLPDLAEGAILMALGLIDLSLSANLLLIVVFSGYENFVSKIETADHEDRPSWMGTVDFSGLKMKLIASIVAISAISLLRTFLELGDKLGDTTAIYWKVVIHLTFVVSGLLLAVMDWIASRAEPHAPSDTSKHS